MTIQQKVIIQHIKGKSQSRKSTSAWAQWGCVDADIWSPGLITELLLLMRKISIIDKQSYTLCFQNTTAWYTQLDRNLIISVDVRTQGLVTNPQWVLITFFTVHVLEFHLRQYYWSITSDSFFLWISTNALFYSWKSSLCVYNIMRHVLLKVMVSSNKRHDYK